MNEKIAICTLACKNQLGYVRVLAESLQKNQPEMKVFLLLVDRCDGYFDPKNEPFEVILAEELIDPGKNNRIFFEYIAAELKVAFKPYFFEHLLKHKNIQKLIYLDPDVYVMESLESLAVILDKSSLIIFPPFTSPNVQNSEFRESDLLKAGIFHKSLLGLANTPHVLSFLQSRQENLYNFGALDPAEGPSVDKKSIHLIREMMSEVYILNDRAVPFFQFGKIDLKKIDESRYEAAPTYLESNWSSPVGAIHGGDSVELQKRSALDLKCSKSFFREYCNQLVKQGQLEIQDWPYAYDYFANGVKIPLIARKLYQLFQEMTPLNLNLTSAENSLSFFDWLNKPVRDCNVGKAQKFISNVMWEIYQSRLDLQESFPEPRGKDLGAFLEWIRRFGHKEYQLPGECLPSLSTRDRRDLMHYYLAGMKRAFKQARTFLDARLMMKFAVRIFEWLSLMILCLKDFLQRCVEKEVPLYRRRPFGVNIAGWISGEFGVGEAARCSIRALRAVNFPYVLNGLTSLHHRHGDLSFDHFSRTHPYRVNLIHLNAPDTLTLMDQKGKQYMRSRYNIGFWFWELSSFPESWTSYFDYYQEIWVASSFTQECISKVSTIPVTKVTLPVFLEDEIIEKNRPCFSLPEHSFVFLFAFDFHSYFERKNPIAVIDAFSRAFNDSDNASLVIKSINAQHFPSKALKLEKAIRGKKVQWIDEHLNDHDMINLMSIGDCYISLHRSEGLGLGMAQAMYLGKPVIATGYSGNLDFMNDRNSFLVKYDLVELIESFSSYERGNVWAEPDINHASQLMRMVYDDRAAAQNKARQAALDIRRLMNVEVAGSEMVSRLRVAADS